MSAVIRPSVSLISVYLYRDSVDFRKSFKGLAVLVEQELGHNPFDGHLYVFTNRHHYCPVKHIQAPDFPDFGVNQLSSSPVGR